MTFKPKCELNERNVGGIFLLTLLILGWAGHKDYGVAVDEYMNLGMGKDNYQYIFEGNENILTEKDHDTDYGAVYYTFLYFLEKEIGYSSEKSHIEANHLINFIIFAIGVYFFYRLCATYFGDWRWAALASSMLALTPTIFAHAFFNLKDIPFMAAYTVGIYTLTRYAMEKNVRNALIHAIATALAINMRLPGLMLVATTFLVLFAEAIVKRKFGRGELKAGTAYLAATLFLMVLFWPYMWSSPLERLGKVFGESTNYSIFGGSVLFMCEYLKNTAIPWHYIPVWIGVSAPTLYLVGFIVGFPHEAKRGFIACRQQDGKFPQIMALFLWLIIPFASVTILKPVLYDGWRHMYFIYPAIVFFGALGLKVIHDSFRSRGARALFLAAIMVSLAFTGYWMVINHPFQHVYFNILGHTLWSPQNCFDLDYWGTSNRAQLERLLELDGRESIRVFSAESLFMSQNNFMALDESLQKRLWIVYEPSDADYMITTLRWGRDGYSWAGKEVSSIDVDGVRINVAYDIAGRNVSLQRVISGIGSNAYIRQNMTFDIKRPDTSRQ